MYNIEDVLKYNIKVPYPRWIKGMDQKCCFATNLGWVLLKNNDKKEFIMMIRNLDLKINEYVKNFNIIVQKDSLDKEFEMRFNRSYNEEPIKEVNNKDKIEEQPIKEVNNKEIQFCDVKFDFIELENDIEDKSLRKGNLVRIYLTWTDSVNIRSFDKKRTYIEVFDNKMNKLGNAEYRSRETEKTLMFVYKVGKEKLSSINISSKIYDGQVRNKQNISIENIDKIYTFNVKINL